MSAINNRRFVVLAITYILSVFGTSFTQNYNLENNPLFGDTVIPDIHIFIDPDSLAEILAPENAESDYEYPATFVFQSPVLSDTIENVGFRIRGNTSRHAVKKSFKVSFNSFERGKKFLGVEKLNINSQQNDPSIIRSKLCMDIFKKMRVPAMRTNHVRLFINNEYHGLYINTEHIDENFVQLRYDNNDGDLFKCLYPADLDYLGTNPELYKLTSGNRRAYDLKRSDDDDYSALADFIVNLNLTPGILVEEVLAKIFDINAFLRTLAVDVAVGSWDDYWFLKNNFYLYHNPATDIWHFIPYDYDNTFGIDWVGGDWGTRDIYNWGNSNEARPLVTKILSIPKLRDRYSYYLNRVLNTAFHPDTLFPRIDELYGLITNAAEADPYRPLDFGFSVDDFHNSYDAAIGHTNHVDYGLKPYVETRRNTALSQLELNDISPILENLSYFPHQPQVGDEVVVRIRVEDEDAAPEVLILYEFNGESGEAVMYDDGMHGDGAASDLIYAGAIPAQTERGELAFYVRATDNTNKSDTFPLKGQQNKIRLQVGYDVPGLFINEFMASNNSTIMDNNGGFSDWIEIYNGDTGPVWLGDKFLTDNLGNPDKWAFPDTTLEPGAVLLIWADDDSEQGSLHTDYKLDADGEQIGIFRQSGEAFLPIDTLSYGPQQSDISFGRNPDGGNEWQYFENPTPGKLNAVPANVRSEKLTRTDDFSLSQNYPNPFNPTTQISYTLANPGRVSLKVYDVLGREVVTLVDEHQAASRYAINLDAVTMVSGVYFYRLEVGGKLIATRKMLLLR